MKTIISFLLVSMISLNFGQLYSGEWIVKHQINSPTNNSYGLAWDGEYLWLSGSVNTIYKINPVNGEVISQFQINIQSYVEDLAWDGEFLWVCDKMPLVSPKLIHKINTSTMQIIESIEVDALEISNLNGLTYSEGQLVVGDADGNLYFINPSTGELENTQNAAPGIVTGADGLTWDNANLWLSHNNGNIYKIDRESGNILDYFEGPGGSAEGPEGLAWDDSYLWYVDNDEDKIYQLELINQKVNGSTEPGGDDIIICNSSVPNRSVYFDISGFNTIDSAKLAFGYFNFDWMAEEYPFDITQDHLNFTVIIDQIMIYQNIYMTEDKIKYAETDVLPYINNQDSLRVDFNNTNPLDALGVVQPVLLITGNNETNSISEKGFYRLNPSQILLEQNSPNPFSETTEINFQIKKAGNVNVSILSMEGENIATLMNEYKPEGNYSIYWNGKSKSGANLESGTYILSVQCNQEQVSKKLTLLR